VMAAALINAAAINVFKRTIPIMVGLIVVLILVTSSPSEKMYLHSEVRRDGETLQEP
jgi:hypothetical protein